MQDRPTVTAADIARLAGVGRAAVSNWRKRHADFPAPVGGTATSPEFDLGEVEAWLRAQGKLPELSREDRLWRHLVAAGDNHAETLATVGEFLCARQRGEPSAVDEHDPRLAELLREVAALADERGAQATLDDLWRHVSESGSGLARATPDELADLMVDLAGVAGGSLFDPACGTGGALRAAARAGCAAAYGQELDPLAARLARVWLTLHGIDGDVRAGDSLRADAFPGLTVDAVVCHPPFGVTNWGQEELAYDPRWEYGLPPRTEPELAWVQHALAHLRPGGHAVLLMPPSAASRRAGRRIRAELLRRGALRAVIALPARAAAPHGVPLHLWLLQRPPGDAPLPTWVLMIDASGLADADLSDVYSRVLETCRALGDAPEADVDEPGFARAVPTIELLDEEVDLTPARRQPTRGGERSGQRLARTQERLAAIVSELPSLMPQVSVETQDGAALPTVTVAELVRAGALRLLGPVKVTARKAPDDREPAGEHNGTAVLTVEDVLKGRHATGGEADRLGQRIPLVAGDVVVPTSARQLTARVVTAGGALLGPNLYLLRPNPAVLDPWFLAGQLRTSSNERQASSLSGTPRFDVRRAQVPRIPLAEQQRYAEVFRRLDALEKALREAAALGAELVQLAADGLARGVLHPTSRSD